MLQVFFLNPMQTILVNVVAWVIIQLSIGYLSSRIPLDQLDPNAWFFQSFAWEQDGEIYQSLFHVRAWKRLIPNGSALYRGAFSIKNLTSGDRTYLERWLKESVRAEICHWRMIVPCVFFFLWNSVTGGWVNVAYALVSNLMPIVLQRYNRPRMRKLLTQLERKTFKKGYTYVPQKELSHSY